MKKRELGNSRLEVSSLGGAAAVELTANDLERIEASLSNITVQGNRYPAHLQARVGR